MTLVDDRSGSNWRHCPGVAHRCSNEAAFKAGETAKNEQFNFVFKTDDSASVVAAGSLEEAVKKLNNQIKEIAKKSPQSDKDKARQEGTGKPPSIETQGAPSVQDQRFRFER